MSRLHRETGISMSNLRRFEGGQGCTLTVERKLAAALRTAEGCLWRRYEWSSLFALPVTEARWHFVVWEECPPRWNPCARSARTTFLRS